MAPVETEYYDLVRFIDVGSDEWRAHLLRPQAWCSDQCGWYCVEEGLPETGYEGLRQFWLSLLSLFTHIFQYHPDKNPSVDAEEKFKEIRSAPMFLNVLWHFQISILFSKAYQVLSDPVRRPFWSVYMKRFETNLHPRIYAQSMIRMARVWCVLWFFG